MEEKVRFFNLEFIINNSVIRPQALTETLVHHVLENESRMSNQRRALDLCTGSGNIAITLSKETPMSVEGADVLSEAILLARLNNSLLQGNADFYEMDIFKEWQELKSDKYDVITANPPYWSIGDLVKRFGKVPEGQLDSFLGGNDGLKFYRQIIGKAPQHLTAGGRIYMEHEPTRYEEVRDMLKKDFYNITVRKDYKDRNRTISGQLRD